MNGVVKTTQKNEPFANAAFGVSDLIGHENVLRKYAIFLCGNPSLADDLVQETFFKAIKHADLYEQGTHFKKWAMTILHNTYLSQIRKTQREVEDVDGHLAGMLFEKPVQEDAFYLSQVMTELDKLPPGARSVTLLIRCKGYTLEEAARILEIHINAVKARAFRGRESLLRKFDEADHESGKSSWNNTPEWRASAGQIFRELRRAHGNMSIEQFIEGIPNALVYRHYAELEEGKNKPLCLWQDAATITVSRTEAKIKHPRLYSRLNNSIPGRQPLLQKSL